MNVERIIDNMANWKAVGSDLVQCFWFKRLTDLLQQQRQEYLDQSIIPEWILKCIQMVGMMTNIVTIIMNNMIS